MATPVLSAPILAITAGEPAGIGPDLCVQIAQQAWDYQILVICDKQLLLDRAQQLGLPLEVSDFDESSLQTKALNQKKILLKKKKSSPGSHATPHTVRC